MLKRTYLDRYVEKTKTLDLMNKNTELKMIDSIANIFNLQFFSCLIPSLLTIPRTQCTVFIFSPFALENITSQRHEENMFSSFISIIYLVPKP